MVVTLQRTINLVLNFCLKFKNSRNATTISAKKKKKKKKKSRRAARSNVIPHRELVFLHQFSPRVSVLVQSINGYFSVISVLFLCRTEKELRDVNRLLDECSSQRAKISEP